MEATLRVLCWFLWVLFWDEELACPLFSLPFLLGNLKIRGQDDISTPKRTFAKETLGNAHWSFYFLSEYRTFSCSNSITETSQKAISIYLPNNGDIHLNIRMRNGTSTILWLDYLSVYLFIENVQVKPFTRRHSSL